MVPSQFATAFPQKAVGARSPNNRHRNSLLVGLTRSPLAGPSSFLGLFITSPAYYSARLQTICIARQLRKGHRQKRQSSPLRQIRLSQKQKTRLLCNFFSIRDSLPSPQSEIRPPNSRLSALSRLNQRLRRCATIRNRKKVAKRARFLFLASRNSF